MTNRLLTLALIVLLFIGICFGWNVPLTHLVLSLGVIALTFTGANLWDELHAETE